MDRADLVQTLLRLQEADAAVADGARCAELLGDIAQVRGWLDAREAAVTGRLGELHEHDGGAAPADVHARETAVSAAAARRKQRRADTIARAPVFGEALAAGRIGAEHVDALANATAKLSDEVHEQLLESIDTLLAYAEALPPDRFARQVRDRARRLERDGGADRNEQQRRETFLSRKLNPRTGMIEGRFALHPELANQIFGAIDREVAAIIAEGEQAGDPGIIDRSFDRNRLAADAWGRLVAGGHQQRRPLEADITLVVDHGTAVTGRLHEHSVCETADGAELPPVSLQRLLCGGRVTPVIVDSNGVVLDAGRTIRHANRHQRRALRAMYRTCAFAECDVAFDRCEIHHLLPWELGGATDLENLVPICSRHHHLAHEHGWSLDLTRDRTLTIRQPDGQVFAVTRPDVLPDRHDRHDRHDRPDGLDRRRRRTAA